MFCAILSFLAIVFCFWCNSEFISCNSVVSIFHAILSLYLAILFYFYILCNSEFLLQFCCLFLFFVQFLVYVLQFFFVSIFRAILSLSFNSVLLSFLRKKSELQDIYSEFRSCDSEFYCSSDFISSNSTFCFRLVIKKKMQLFASQFWLFS